ncbi:hypothetical protein [Zafaria cholistanensis]|uniref:hypothetical protein n=1 Tax=Zafaria cholistanensis TaxID=1682741 RepID=UPI0012311B1F|nr:hypothetical protein [Zafaria cholistanensis]
MAGQYLKGASPVVTDDFLWAVPPPGPAENDEQDLVWLSKFMGLAALLTRCDEVQKVLDESPWQAVQSV